MNKLSFLPFAAVLAFSALTQAALAADDPHAAHAAAQAGQAPAGAGMQHGGGMHEMMQQHMQGMREHGGKERKGYADVVLQYGGELKLTDEQIGKITRIHMENQKKVDELGPKLHETLKAAHEVYLNPASDEAAIRKAAKEHSVAFEEFLEVTLKSRNAINAVLTPEQLKQLQSKKTTP